MNLNNIIEVKINHNNKIIKLLKNTNINIYKITYKLPYIIIKINKKDYKKLSSLTKTTIIKEYSYTYYLTKIKNNIIEITTIILFILLTYLISNTIIKINIVTNNTSLNKLLINELEKQNIVPYKYKLSDKELNKIKKEIINNNKDKIEWLNIERIGMTYKINIEEKVIANKKEHHDFCNIVATKEGTISKIITKEGTNLVDTNEHVNTGDILITGEIKYNEEIKGLVCAEGEVYAKTWYTINISIPKTYKKIEKKDKYYNNIYITFNNKTKKLFNKKRNNIKAEVTDSINIFNIKIDKVKEYETTITTKQYTEIEIDDKIQELINKNLQPILKDNNHIIEQKVLKKNNFNSTIEVEIFIVVEEQIGHTIYTTKKDDNND